MGGNDKQEEPTAKGGFKRVEKDYRRGRGRGHG